MGKVSGNRTDREMKYDIENPESRDNLLTIIRQRVQDATSKHDEMKEEWDKADQYYENDQTPPGFSDSHRDALANANDPTQGNPYTKQYVVHNRVLRSHLAIMGEFSDGQKTIKVHGRTPKDRKYANKMQEIVQYVQDHQRLWSEVHIPTVDCGTRRGIHWIKVWHNPERDLPNGRIEVREVSCRQVLLDATSRGYFYQNDVYRIERMRMNVNEANEKFADILDNLGLGYFAPDNVYEQAYRDPRTGSLVEQYCTIYEVQYKEVERRYYKTDENGEALQIGKDEFVQVTADPSTANKAWSIMEDVYYVAWYNESVGVFYNVENEYGQFTLIPFMHVRSEGRLYPMGSTKYEANLQDLTNVMLSVMLDNLKESKGKWMVDPQSFALYGDQITAAALGRGAPIFPANTMQHFKPNELTQASVALFGLIGNALDDTQSQHDLSKGIMPKERLAAQTVNTIISQDRKGHGLKDEMINWTFSQVGRLIMKIIQAKWTEKFWVQITDAGKKDPDYVPVNLILTEQEYFELMMELAGVQIEGGETPEEMMAKEQAVNQFQSKFEREQEVQMRIEKIYEFDGQKFSEDQLSELYVANHMTPEEFLTTYRPTVTNIPVYVINNLNRENADLDLVWSIDFNADRDKQVRTGMAFQNFDRGVITGLELLKAQEYPNAEAAWAEAQKANEVVRVGEMVIGNPQLYDMIMNAAQSLQNAQGGEKKTKGGGDRKKPPTPPKTTTGTQTPQEPQK